MKILFLGGNGNISWWCVKEALANACDVTVVTRGVTRKTRRSLHKSANYVNMDANDGEAIARFLEVERFDLICDFVAYDDKVLGLRLPTILKSRSRYVVISSTVIFHRDSQTNSLDEDSLLRRVGWSPYVDGKIKMESLLHSEPEIMNNTLIVRPSHTFDTNVPTPLGSNCFTEISRVLKGGNLLLPIQSSRRWTIMHSEDFARAWFQLIQVPDCFGTAVNLVADQSLSWEELARDVIKVLGLPENRIRHISDESIESVCIEDEVTAKGSNLGMNYAIHRKWNDEYDISKLKSYIPQWKSKRTFLDGFSETYEWLRDRPERQRINHFLYAALHSLDKTASQETT